MKAAKKRPSVSPKRIRQPTNITLDPLVKAEAKKYAASEGANLAGLVTVLLVERLKAAGLWPPK